MDQHPSHKWWKQPIEVIGTFKIIYRDDKLFGLLDEQKFNAVPSIGQLQLKQQQIVAHLAAK